MIRKMRKTNSAINPIASNTLNQLVIQANIAYTSGNLKRFL